MKRKKSTFKKYRVKSKIKSKKYKKYKRTKKNRKIRKVRKSRKNKMKGAGVDSSCEPCNQGDGIHPDISETRFDRSKSPSYQRIEREIAQGRAKEKRIAEKNKRIEQINYNNNRFRAAEVFAKDKFGRSPESSPASSRRQDESHEIRGRSNSYSASSDKISNMEVNNEKETIDVDEDTTDVGDLAGIEREQRGISRTKRIGRTKRVGRTKRDAKFWVADTAPSIMGADHGPKDSSDGSEYSSGYSYLDETDESDEEAIQFYN